MAKKPQISLVGTAPATGPQPPRPLDKYGRSLWSRVLSEYEITDASGVEYLTQACEGLDLIGELREQIARDGAVVLVRGVPKAHPALRDLLAAKAFVTRTLGRLNLDTEAIKPIGRPAGRGGWRGFED
jgi:hypothetical protein